MPLDEETRKLLEDSQKALAEQEKQTQELMDKKLPPLKLGE